MKVLQRCNTAACIATLVILGVVLLCAPSAANGQAYLYNRSKVLTGNGPAGIAVADFNHDHKLDLGVTISYDNSVSVSLKLSDGSFSNGVAYPTGQTPSAVVTSDFRGDGRIDLAVINNYNGSGNPGAVSILLGNGNGTFQAHVDYFVGNSPTGIVTGDVNEDGKLDIAVLNEYDSTVSILLGNGDGTFQSQTTVSVGSGPTSIAIGDSNGDRKADLVTTNIGSGTVSILLSQSNGSFTRVDSRAPISSPDNSRVVTGDFNGDGKLDVVISSSSRQELFMLLGEGTGSLQAPIAIQNVPVDAISNLVAADFNHDGRLDLAAAGGNGTGGIVVALGKGDGTFEKPIISPADSILVLFATDLNGDGRLDLISAYYGGSVGLLLGKGDGTFSTPKRVILAQTPVGVEKVRSTEHPPGCEITAPSFLLSLSAKRWLAQPVLWVG